MFEWLAVRQPLKAESYQFLWGLRLGSLAAVDGLLELNSPALVTDQYNIDRTAQTSCQ